MKDALREAAAYDVDPELSPAAQYMRNEMGLAGYKHLLSAGAWKPNVQWGAGRKRMHATCSRIVPHQSLTGTLWLVGGMHMFYTIGGLHYTELVVSILPFTCCDTCSVCGWASGS